MTADEYVPDEQDLEVAWIEFEASADDINVASAEFDRFLARVRRDAIEEAEARIDAVRELCDTAPNGEDLDPLSSHYSSGYELALQDIRRALDGER